jgi:hypothetical protein
LAGENLGCGCSLTPRSPRETPRASTAFSASVAASEGHDATYRLKARPT